MGKDNISLFIKKRNWWVRVLNSEPFVSHVRIHQLVHEHSRINHTYFSYKYDTSVFVSVENLYYVLCVKITSYINILNFASTYANIGHEYPRDFRHLRSNKKVASNPLT